MVGGATWALGALGVSLPEASEGDSVGSGGPQTHFGGREAPGKGLGPLGAFPSPPPNHRDLGHLARLPGPFAIVPEVS